MDFSTQETTKYHVREYIVQQKITLELESWNSDQEDDVAYSNITDMFN